METTFHNDTKALKRKLCSNLESIASATSSQHTKRDVRQKTELFSTMFETSRKNDSSSAALKDWTFIFTEPFFSESPSVLLSIFHMTLLASVNKATNIKLRTSNTMWLQIFKNVEKAYNKNPHQPELTDVIRRDLSTLTKMQNNGHCCFTVRCPQYYHSASEINDMIRFTFADYNKKWSSWLRFLENNRSVYKAITECALNIRTKKWNTLVAIRKEKTKIILEKNHSHN